MAPAAPVNFVGYTEIGGLPYIWAASENEIEAFSLSGGNAQPIWASTGGSSPSGYLPNSSGNLVSSSAVMALQSNGQISAAPALINGVLFVPVYVPPTGTCGETGTGYYDLFDLVSGGLPKIPITYKNNAVTNGVISLGLGTPYTPSYTVTASGTMVYPGNSLPPTSKQGINPNAPNQGINPNAPNQGINPIELPGLPMSRPIAWRQY
jgi:type IV pilus assembly protein PilY1